MKQKIESLNAQLSAAIANVQNKEQLAAFWQEYLGKKGHYSLLMTELRNVPAEERPQAGKVINEAKKWAEAQYQELSARIAQIELEAQNAREAVDITMPATRRPAGSLHPITIVKDQMIDVFAGMGFEIYEGPEIEDDDHNFTRLNVHKNHPARDMQDTFYVADDIVLRTHTSPGQIRVMDSQQPPIKVLVPGRVFRSDSDATHSPMFHQMEGLVVDKGITLCDLQGMLDKFVQALFSADVKTRLRPSYFPFTEPSVEVDVSCFACGGKGCSLCKGTGWIEVLGGGVVHRQVLQNCGVDPDVYSGFAFGIGIERITMLKYGINNMGYLFENDVRFLKQFKD
ncbi:MAG: phenylalanine--tRNA ligase subunit alpha [Clostridia bacterium]|nr:phenylalanine--tRNA ligase subunit alpha [Clostridia bacterium]